MKRIFAGSVFMWLLSYLFACNTPASPVKTKEFINKSNIDSSIKPGDNFFLFVNGKWLKSAVIPPSESSVGAGLELFDRTKANLHHILDSLSKEKFSAGSIEQKTGDFYASGMDSASIEKSGYDPVKPYLQKIAALKNAGDVLQFVEEQQTNNNNLLFSMSVGADEKNSAYNIAIFTQGGLGLPD